MEGVTKGNTAGAACFGPMTRILIFDGGMEQIGREPGRVHRCDATLEIRDDGSIVTFYGDRVSNEWQSSYRIE